jgi:hypothetical protein
LEQAEQAQGLVLQAERVETTQYFLLSLQQVVEVAVVQEEHLLD